MYLELVAAEVMHRTHCRELLPAKQSATSVLIDTLAWGPARIEQVDIDLLAEWNGMSGEQCVERLRTYRLHEAADLWHQHGPSNERAIRNYYAETDLYLWELMAWNHSEHYQIYREYLDRLLEHWPPYSFPTALDYGSGVGTAAIRLAEMGYAITIADIPGRTFDFARERLTRRGINFDAIAVTGDVPQLRSKSADVLVCFDVIEHCARPGAVARALARAIKPGGGATVVASFDTAGDDYPHHLSSGRKLFSGHRWPFFFNGLGFEKVADGVHVRTAGVRSVAHKLSYRTWRATGLYVTWQPR